MHMQWANIVLKSYAFLSNPGRACVPLGHTSPVETCLRELQRLHPLNIIEGPRHEDPGTCRSLPHYHESFPNKENRLLPNHIPVALGSLGQDCPRIIAGTGSTRPRACWELPLPRLGHLAGDLGVGTTRLLDRTASERPIHVTQGRAGRWCPVHHPYLPSQHSQTLHGTAIYAYIGGQCRNIWQSHGVSGIYMF